MRNGLVKFLPLMAAVALAAACGPRHANVSYQNDIGPILAAKCTGCHAPGQKAFEASGLDTTSYAALMAGGKQGPMLQPGDEFTSVRALLYGGDAHGRKRLSEDEFATLKVWVCEGAKDN